MVMKSLVCKTIFISNRDVGPNVAFYTIEYLLANFNYDPMVTRLLKQREIILTPMTNAVGYYHYEREERINRDHPAFRENVHRLKGLRVHE